MILPLKIALTSFCYIPIILWRRLGKKWGIQDLVSYFPVLVQFEIVNSNYIASCFQDTRLKGRRLGNNEWMNIWRSICKYLYINVILAL